MLYSRNSSFLNFPVKPTETCVCLQKFIVTSPSKKGHMYVFPGDTDDVYGDMESMHNLRICYSWGPCLSSSPKDIIQVVDTEMEILRCRLVESRKESSPELLGFPIRGCQRHDDRNNGRTEK